MARSVQTTPGHPLSGAEVRRACGDVPDWKIEAIVESGADAAELSAALAWVQGADDLGRQLSGGAGQVYDILTADEPPEDDR